MMIGATEGVFAVLWAFRAVHLGASWALAEVLLRLRMMLIGAELATGAFATRVMVVVRAASILRAMLTAGRFVTRSFRAVGVIFAWAWGAWHVLSAPRIGSALRLRTPAAWFGAFGIPTLGLGAAGIGVVAGGFLAAVRAESRRIGAATLRRGRRFGSFLRRKRGDAEGAEAQQHETMAGFGFHGLELGC